MLGPSFAAATRFSRKQEKARCNAADLWHLEHCHSRARLVQAAGAPGVTAHHASHGYPISPDGRKNWNWFDVGQVIGDHGGCLLLLLLIIAHFHLKVLGWPRFHISSLENYPLFLVSLFVGRKYSNASRPQGEKPRTGLEIRYPVEKRVGSNSTSIIILCFLEITINLQIASKTFV